MGRFQLFSFIFFYGFIGFFSYAFTHRFNRVMTNRLNVIDLYYSTSKSPTIAHLSSSESNIIDLSDVEDGISNQVEALTSALRNVIDPDLGTDIITLGFVKDLMISSSNDVSFTMDLPTSYMSLSTEFRDKCTDELSKISWVGKLYIKMIFPDLQVEKTSSKSDKQGGMVGIKHIIAVSSCKGGVGKSTVAVNLAYTLSMAGAKVGILDADIYGPSLPTMTKPVSTDVPFRNNKLYPLEYEGVKLMSMGFINKGASIMRGPMVNQVLNQFVSLTQWDDLDYLLVDMPPGTGDIQLTLAQIMNISAAVIVTTPQRLSFVDVVKGIDLFDTVNVPCVAVVENMAEYKTYSFNEDFFRTIGEKAASIATAASLSQSTSTDPSKSFKAVTDYLKTAIESQRQPHKLFGAGHLQRLKDMWGIANLISLPLQEDVARSGDSGRPYVLQYPDSDVALAMEDLAVGVVQEIERLRQENDKLNSLIYDAKENICLFNNKNVSPAALRKSCRCAVCVEEFSGRPLLDPATIPENIKPLAMAPIGRYAMSVDWSDGHKSLYPFKQIEVIANL